MLLTDVNILIYAYREESRGHREFKRWLEDALSGSDPFGVSDVVLSGFLRIVTHPRIFRVPTPVAEAIEFASIVRGHPNSVVVSPGPQHWDIFSRLCIEPGVSGNLVSDAYFAALAIESGCEWITMDEDYARFPGLTWRRPF